MSNVEHIEDHDCVITIDQQRLPLLIVTWRGKPTARAANDYFDRMTKLCESMGRKKFVSIVDTRAADIPDDAVRTLVGERIATAHPIAEKVLLSSVVIVHSAVMRGTLTAVQWALRGENHVVAVNDFPSAFEVASGVLRRAEIPVPTDLSVPVYDLPSSV